MVRIAAAALTALARAGMAEQSLAGPANICRTGQQLTNGHCCPNGESWIPVNGVPRCADDWGAAYHITIKDQGTPLTTGPIVLPSKNKQKPCKALHTC